MKLRMLWLPLLLLCGVLGARLRGFVLFFIEGELDEG